MNDITAKAISRYNYKAAAYKMYCAGEKISDHNRRLKQMITAQDIKIHLENGEEISLIEQQALEPYLR